MMGPTCSLMHSAGGCGGRWKGICGAQGTAAVGLGCAYVLASPGFDCETASLTAVEVAVEAPHRPCPCH
eukprot:scaffold107394_cov50-Prasinocladus_malaysianus.AAC.1